MRRTLTKYQYDFLKREFSYLEENGKLLAGQTEELLANYDAASHVRTKRTFNPISILLIIGAVLIGLSILSFVASNWSAMNDLAKFLLLLFLLIGFYFSGYRLEKKNSKLSKTCYYIGACAFGAEIFYIGQLFHLGGDPDVAFLMWGIGTLPLGFYLKEEPLKLISLFFIYVFIHQNVIFVDSHIAYLMVLVLPLMFMFGHYVMKHSLVLLVVHFIVLYEFVHIHLLYRPVIEDSFPIWVLLVLPGLFYLGHRFMQKSLPLFTLNLLLSLQTIGAIILLYLNEDYHSLVYVIYFLLGIVFAYVQPKDYRVPMKAIGMTLHLIFGLVLTFADAWSEAIIGNPDVTSVVFAVLYGLYALYLVQKGSLFGVTIVCLLVIRFYVDLSFAFMNKSIAFLVGGVLLIGLGCWFERTRKGEANRRANK